MQINLTSLNGEKHFNYLLLLRFNPEISFNYIHVVAIFFPPLLLISKRNSALRLTS